MPELIEDQNDKIQSRLQEGNLEEVTNILQQEMGHVEIFPNNLDTMSAEEVGETLTNIVKIGYIPAVDPVVVPKEKQGLASVTVEKKVEPVVTKKAPRVPKAVAAKIDASIAIQKLREQATKTNLLIELIEWADECVNVQDMPADLDKGPRDLLIAYTKELEAIKATYIQKIQSL